MNLTSLLKNNLLDEDGIEDLHFYFVSFNQHKKGVLGKFERKIEGGQQDIRNKRQSADGRLVSKTQLNSHKDDRSDVTIEVIDEEDLF